MKTGAQFLHHRLHYQRWSSCSEIPQAALGQRTDIVFPCNMGLEVSAVNTGFKHRASAPWGQLLCCGERMCPWGLQPRLGTRHLPVLRGVGQKPWWGRAGLWDVPWPSLPAPGTGCSAHFWHHTSSCGREKSSKNRWLQVPHPSCSPGAASPVVRVQKLASSAFRSLQLLLGGVFCPSESRHWSRRLVFRATAGLLCAPSAHRLGVVLLDSSGTYTGFHFKTWKSNLAFIISQGNLQNCNIYFSKLEL